MVLVTVVVGSGIMGTNLSDDDGVALIINQLSTSMALVLLILVLGVVSGAHFNPVVSLYELLLKKINVQRFTFYTLSQVAGAITGAILANTMFGLEALQTSTKDRIAIGNGIGEILATAGLIIVIGVLVNRNQQNYIPAAVAAWIGSAYYFTASTSFANPAVTIGRAFTDTFSGIAPSAVAFFVLFQLIGLGVGMLAVNVLKDANV
ncbi:MAG: hypothetical protein RL038_33 [Actinomycetota bacterium]